MGASDHRKPLRLMNIIPLKTRPLSQFEDKPLPGNGSSTRGLPWLFGKTGRRRSI